MTQKMLQLGYQSQGQFIFQLRMSDPLHFFVSFKKWNLVVFVAGWEQKYLVVRFIKTSGLLTDLYGNDLRSPSICQATFIIPSN